MSSEKMAILRMLEEGKITAENAANLLASLGETESAGASGTEERNFGQQTRSGPRTERADSRWVADLGRKFEVVAKDLEPKIQKLAGVVIEKSVEIADNVTKSVSTAREKNAEREAAASVQPKNTGAAAPFAATSSASAAKSFELPVSSGVSNEIILKSPKGNITIKGYNGDKVTVIASPKRRTGVKELDFLMLGCVYQLNYDAEDYEALGIDVFLPSALFKRVSIETSDGNVTVDNIDVRDIVINTSKCHVYLKNVTAGSLKIDNINGDVLLGSSSGEQLLVENACGIIDASNTDFKRLVLETTSEAVSLVTQGFYKYSDYDWTVRTSNARLKASLPVSANVGYDIKAYTSLSDVSNGLSGISYSRNDRNCIEGKSEGYGERGKKVKIELETSNAPLSIN